MRKIIVLLLITSLAASAAFAQELSISAEAKSGLLWEKTEKVAQDAKENVSLGSKDDAGDSTGRFRLNMDYTAGNMGVKLRLQWDNWGSVPATPDWWSYAFGYGNFFEDQLTVAVGKLGASPWGTGGPEMWKELEVTKTGGMRIEWKPNFVPGNLNLGFVLNSTDGGTDRGLSNVDVTLAQLLRESVLGVSYSNDYFLLRFAYRLDSDLDTRPGSGVATGVREGDDLIYRVEEYALQNLLAGLKMWALGYWAGVGAEDESCFEAKNWLFAEYAPDLFTAQIRLGYDVITDRSVLHFRPSFYLNLFDKLLSVGAAFLYGQDFGNEKYPGSPFDYVEFEPKIQVNFSPNAYVAFAYNWRQEYVSKDQEQPNQAPIDQYQWMNLRFGLTL